MLNVLRRNFGLKVLSLALAVAAWAYFRFAANPVIAAHFDQQLSVPITVTGLRPGNSVRYAEKQALVTIVTPRVGPAIKPEQVRAVVNLANRPAGVYNVPVTIIGSSLEIKALAPASINVSIDRLDSRTIPVAIVYSGERHAGIVADVPVLNPPVVTITGIATDLAHVEAARIDVPFAAAASQYDAMVRPVAVDARGETVTGVQISPDLVRVRARFMRTSAEQK